MAPTLYDVARAAGVSYQTVSNALNTPDRVRPETRDRVLAAANRLGYVANASARRLGRGQSNVIGLSIPALAPAGTSEFLDHFLLPFVVQAQSARRRVLMYDAADDPEEHGRLIRSRAVDTVVLLDTQIDDPRVTALGNAGLPFVAFGRTGTEQNHAWVDVDNAHAMELAAARLAEHGHRTVAYVDRDVNRFYVKDRTDGLSAAARRHGLRVIKSPIPAGETGPEAGRARLAALLNDPDAPRAVIAGSDLLALTAIHVARERGMSIGPDDFSVIACDDTRLAELTEPAITVVHQPLDQVIKALIDLSLSVTNGAGAEHHLLKPTLTIRATA